MIQPACGLHRMWDVAKEMEIEDGVIWGYVVGEDAPTSESKTSSN